MPPHEHNVEVFGGSGAVLFAREPSVLETYNDINHELVIANFQAPGMSPMAEMPPLAEDKTLPVAERHPARLSRTPHVYLSDTQA